jgi:hypothetical protein
VLFDRKRSKEYTRFKLDEAKRHLLGSIEFQLHDLMSFHCGLHRRGRGPFRHQGGATKPPMTIKQPS